MAPRNKNKYRTHYDYLQPSPSEALALSRLAYLASSHESGGNYNMLARWVKGSRSAIGKNRLNRPAATVTDVYPDICGIHAELNLFHNSSFRGGTVYIAGAKQRSGTTMLNTHPCEYCMAIMIAAGVRSVVFYKEGIPSKIRL